MPKYKVKFNDELQDEVFDTEEEADEYGLECQSNWRTGAWTLHMSNPGDWDYDEDEEAPDYEIIEIDDDDDE
jgi:hypothetical protein